jgi:hypothetical protein
MVILSFSMQYRLPIVGGAGYFGLVIAAVTLAWMILCDHCFLAVVGL